MESHRPDLGGIWAIRGRADSEAETIGFRPHGQVHDVHNFMPRHRHGRVWAVHAATYAYGVLSSIRRHLQTLSTLPMCLAVLGNR